MLLDSRVTGKSFQKLFRVRKSAKNNFLEKALGKSFSF